MNWRIIMDDPFWNSLLSLLLCIIVLGSTALDIHHHIEIKRLTNEIARVEAKSNDASKILVPNMVNGDGVTMYKVIALNSMDFGLGVTTHIPIYIDEENYELLSDVIRVQIARKNN